MKWFILFFIGCFDIFVIFFLYCKYFTNTTDVSGGKSPEVPPSPKADTASLMTALFPLHFLVMILYLAKNNEKEIVLKVVNVEQ